MTEKEHEHDFRYVYFGEIIVAYQCEECGKTPLDVLNEQEVTLEGWDPRMTWDWWNDSGE